MQEHSGWPGQIERERGTQAQFLGWLVVGWGEGKSKFKGRVRRLNHGCHFCRQLINDHQAYLITRLSNFITHFILRRGEKLAPRIQEIYSDK